MFELNPLYLTDGYKIGHKKMLAPGTTHLYGTWIPRSTKHAPHPSIKKIVSFGQQLTWKYLHDVFQDYFFKKPLSTAIKFAQDMSKYLASEYDGSHFAALHQLGYLPVKVKSLPEGIETDPNVPHMTFVNTHPDFAWLTLYLETIVSSLSWKSSTSATIALRYKRNAYQWLLKTDPDSMFLLPYLCHDFSARGLSPWDCITSGLGHATSFQGSDTLAVIEAARYFYSVPEDEVCVASVNASEHSVSTTCIFTMGEGEMIKYYLEQFPSGILSIVSDTFNLWQLITEYLPPLKDTILNRNGKLVIRPDSGNPADIICGGTPTKGDKYDDAVKKGVVKLLHEIFGGSVNNAGYINLASQIGSIYGDSITLDRQLEIYQRLAAMGYSITNCVLGVGSYTYQHNTRDTLGFAAKGASFTTNGVDYAIYKDPYTDDGTKKSLQGFIKVDENLQVHTNVSREEENTGLLQLIYEDGVFHNHVDFKTIRQRLEDLSKID